MTDVVFFISFFGMISFVIWVLANAWQRRQHVKLVTDFNNRVVERLGSMKEFSEFLHSDGGDRLMKALTAERASFGPRDRILVSVQTGVVFVTVGLGLFLVGGRTTGDEHEVIRVISVILLSLGVGLVLSSAASFWVARHLGMFRAESTNVP
jgi:hypothetical protein